MSMTTVRSGEYRKQAQQQNFLKRIHHLAALSAIWQIFEIIQKTIASQNAPNPLAACSIVPLHQSNQWITTDSAHHTLVTFSPIALCPAPPRLDIQLRRF